VQTAAANTVPVLADTTPSIQGREEEARRFELMQRNLLPVRSEKHLIADALVAQQQLGKGKGNEQGRAS
jgi:hypothetical protein